MLIKNKESWKVKRNNENGEYVIYDNYEIDIIKSLYCHLESEMYGLLFDKNRNVLYFNVNQVMWEICDNGGEFNIKPVNENIPVSVPYTSSLREYALNPSTIAYRLSKVIENFDTYNKDLISWNFIYGDFQSSVFVKMSKINTEGIFQ